MGNIQAKRKGDRLVAMGNKAYRREQYRDAISFHSRAADLLRKFPLARADCLDYLVKEHWRLGEIEEALTCSTESLAIKEKLAPMSDSLAKTLSDIGCIFYERGEYAKALRLLEGALAIRQEVSPGSLGVAVSYTNLALVLAKLGRREEAIKCHEQARSIREEKAPDSASLARTYISLSNNSDSFEQGTEMVNQARAIVAKMNPVPTSLLASLEMSRGNLLLAAGDYSYAVRFFEQAIEKERKIAPDSLNMARMLNQLAKACEEQGLQTEARAARGKSIDIRHRKVPTYLDCAVGKK